MNLTTEYLPITDKYQARISKKRQQDGAIYVYGDLIENGVVIKRHCFRRKVREEKQDSLESVVDCAYKKVASSIPVKRQERKTSLHPSGGNVIDSLLKKFLEENYLFHNEAVVGKKASWNELTHKHVYTYCLAHGYGSYMLNIKEAKDCDAAFAEYRETLIQQTLAHGRSKKQRQQAEQTVDSELARMKILTEEIRKFIPEIPDFPFFGAIKRTIAIPDEQVKALPEAMNQEFRKKLEELANKEPRMVLAGILMFDGGLRTAEAAGISKEDLNRSIIGYALLTIRWQERNGERIERLKTDTAYRYVLISFWASQMVDKCLKILGSTWEDDVLVRSKELSRWVRDRLFECKREFMELAEKNEAQFPDRNEDGFPVRDIAAYVLRRNAASRWLNYDGLSQDVIDYMLGHKRKTTKQAQNLINELDQRAICRCLERYVYSQECTLNPAYSPIELDGNSGKKRIQDFSKYVFVNTSTTPLVVHIDVEALNPNEEILLSVPHNAVNAPIQCRSVRLNPNDRSVFVNNVIMIRTVEEDSPNDERQSF